MNYNNEDLIIKLIDIYKDPYRVQKILKDKYRINIDIKSLCKRLPTYVYNIRSRR
tara:strand:- start:1771 stop:1935 length:165 start_codon:yes stop_codon:yes gene_type:complete